jgi:hypothetical protein
MFFSCAIAFYHSRDEKCCRDLLEKVMNKEGVSRMNLLWQLGRKENVVENLGTKIL